MPLHRADNLVPRKVLRAASAGSVYFNRSTNACVATLFYDKSLRHFIQLIYFSASGRRADSYSPTPARTSSRRCHRAHATSAYAKTAR